MQKGTTDTGAAGRLFLDERAKSNRCDDGGGDDDSKEEQSDDDESWGAAR